MKSSAAWTRKDLDALAERQPGRLVDLVLDFQSRLQAVEARLAQNSANSHRPPSSDGYAKPCPKSLRQKTGRKPGGQNGHPGYTLQPVTRPDTRITHRLKLCPCGCGKNLRRQPLVRYESRQVFDLPEIRLRVTEHRAEVKVCPSTGREVAAPFPQGVHAPAQYGPYFQGLLSYWRHQQLLPLDRIAQMCEDLFGQRISEATILAVEAKLHQALAPFESQVHALLCQAKLAHFDETGLRVEGSLHWLHNASTALMTWFGVHKKRGHLAMDAFGILPRFLGRAIHDCLESYFRYPCLHGLCGAHLLRELVFLHEVLRQRWARQMHRLLLKMLDAVHDHAPRSPPMRRIAALLRRYRALVAKGLRKNPRQPSTGRRGRPPQSKAYNLLRRLREHEASVLAFLLEPGVPFTNNQSEQDLRMLKVLQKISGGFRTIEGATRFARIRGYISTIRKNNRNILDALADALQHQPFIPQAAA